MNPKASILHISDLHREAENEITNTTLLSSIINSVEVASSESPPIRPPDIAIVSGDLVRGARLGAINHEDEIRRQYVQSIEFLVALCDRLFDGDREKVILVPGNHDVSFNTSIATMNEATLPSRGSSREKEIESLYEKLNKRLTQIRWCWKTLKYHEIKSETDYNKRLELFCDAYKVFYQGRRNYSLDPGCQFDYFEYPNLNLFIGTLNSCFQNDHLRKNGEINSECIAKLCEVSKQQEFRNSLKLAVWHHNLTGGPNDNDYLDPGFIDNLIDFEFALGFHGHQHKTEFIRRVVEFDASSPLTIISAGTLCAGQWGLPPGQTRSFNILEIDQMQENARLHVRNMVGGSFENPVWRKGTISQSNGSFLDFEIGSNSPDSQLVRQRCVDDAVNFIGRSEFRQAMSVLKYLPESTDDSLRTELLIECLIEIPDREQSETDELISLLKHSCADENISAKHVILLLEVLETEGRTLELTELLNAKGIRDSGDPSVKQLVQQLRVKIENE